MKSKKVVSGYIEIRRNKILSEYFKKMYANGRTIFRMNEIKDFFKVNAVALKMKSLSFNKFIEQLEERKYLKTRELDIAYAPKTYYTSKFFKFKNSFEKIVEFSSVIFKKGYFSYYTAMYFNGLTEQIPKIAYINTEQKSYEYSNNCEEIRENLTDEKIAIAFTKEKMQSRFCLKRYGYNIRHIHGKNTGCTGVVKRKLGNLSINVTDVERTLIDITVRPDYAGGISSVLKAFQTTLENPEISLSIKTLIFYLKKINYIYPYHQSVGFLLDCAGFDKLLVNKLHQAFEIKHNFFLIHHPNNKNKENLIYCEKWKIYAPKFLFESFQDGVC